ncbi:hypothetical protein SASPL_119566 [Salvia splendens]|uniref:Uncharacterized protein n=1 Tax=Salvia splendens TaxID=180675 RepID=A0A8X8XSY6_SALSN|nr:hypothetical protein SASPL_119566 [Salvia splendens]
MDRMRRVGDESGEFARGASSRYVHKVGRPQKQRLVDEIRHTLKETFFHDDPFRPFKDHSKSKKLLLGLASLDPQQQLCSSIDLRDDGELEGHCHWAGGGGVSPAWEYASGGDRPQVS